MKANKRTRQCCLVMSAILLCLSSYRPSHSQTDAFSNRLQGTWQGEGKAYGGPCHLQLKWEWVLGNKFLRLSLRSEIGAATSERQVFEGQAYYRALSASKYDAQWFDSRGVSMTIKAQTEGNALVALWSGAEEQGRSTYKFIEAGKLEVSDEVQMKDGSWKEFGHAILTHE